MIYDMHAHIIGLESGRSGNFLCPRRRMNFVLRFVLGRILRRMSREGDPDENLQNLVLKWVHESRVDRVVLLAMDGVYSPTGDLQSEETQFIVSNDYVADFAARDPKLLFGASIHPYRRDAIDELDRVVERGACLIKWLPSAQNIAPDDPRCLAFYDRLAHHRIPLLSHTGIEHTLARFKQDLNNPNRLVPALRRGVAVIAAHCGTRMYLYERSWFRDWVKLTREYPNLYGDLSAFGLPLHGGPLREVLSNDDLLSKVVYGSDAPVPPQPLWFIFWLGWRKALGLHRIANPIEECYSTMKALGVPDTVFGRAGDLLKLPAEGMR